MRSVNQGEGAGAWRQILGEYASTEPGKVLAMWSKLGYLWIPEGSDIVVGINKMEEDMTRYQKMTGENLSDTIKRGILMKALRNEAELQKNVFRNCTRLSTYEKMREEVMSALTTERAVHELMGDDPMEIEAVGKSGKKGRGKKGKGKNDQKGRGKGPGQGKGSGTQNPLQIETATARATSKRNAEFAKPTRGTGNEQQQHQSRRGPGHGRRVASTHDLRGQSHARSTVNSSKVAGDDIPDAACPAPECSDAGLRCSGECCATSADR